MKKYIAEFIGTCVLTFVGCGAAALSGGIGGSLGILGIALAFGLSVTAMAAVFGSISGCHINPAVSLGIFLTGKMSGGLLFRYLIAQFLGGIAGAGLLFLTELTCTQIDIGVRGLGANGFGEFSHVGIGLTGAFMVEVILTFIFVLVVLCVALKAPKGPSSNLVIGLTLALVHIPGIPLTGTSVNPARSFGPALLLGGPALAQVWVFIAAPMIGGAAAAFAYRAFYGKEEAAGE